MNNAQRKTRMDHRTDAEKRAERLRKAQLNRLFGGNAVQIAAYQYAYAYAE